MKTFYTVTFYGITDGNQEVSRHFDTIRAAKNWAKWLATQTWASGVQVWKGGVGGEMVFAL